MKISLSMKDDLHRPVGVMHPSYFPKHEHYYAIA